MSAQLSKSRIAYLESVKCFMESEEPVEVSPVRVNSGPILGWTLARGDLDLEASRGGSKIFKALSSVAVYCTQNDIDSFEVIGL